MDTKKCICCSEEKPNSLDYFPKIAKSNRLQNTCKVCTNKKAMERYFKKHEENILKQRLLRQSKVIKPVVKDGFKICSRCKEEKEFSEFYKNKRSKDGYKSYCKECARKEYLSKQEHYIQKSRLYYETNKEEISIKTKVYKEINKEKYKELHRQLYLKNKDKYKENAKRSLYRRMENDVGFKLLQRCRKRLYEAVKGHVKSARTIELIGCDVDFLRDYIENKFQDGMNWENYGKWHIDHIRPCSSFDFSIPEEQFKCFNYKNLQPLWAKDNFAKSDKIEGSDDLLNFSV